MLKEQSILFTDNLHGQTANGFLGALMVTSNTMTWLSLRGCTDKLQLVDASYGRRFTMFVGKELGTFLNNEDNVEKWESDALSASNHRILFT